MISKFAEATRLWFSHLGLISAIILTVWLPGNLLINYLVFNVFSEEDIKGPALTGRWIEVIFGPIYIGAMIHALSELKQGQRPTYSQSIEVGLNNWGRLFASRLIASFVIAFGFIAFIVPGIVLMVRYALLAPPVVLEGAGPVEAIRRSTALTAGVRWQIFFAALSFFVVFAPLLILIYMPLEIWPQFDTLAANVTLDCVLDVTFGIIQIVMFLYYWQATEQERAAGRADGTAAG